MSIESRIQIEKAARAMAKAVRKNHVVYSMPDGSLGILPEGESAPDGSKALYTAYWEAFDLLGELAKR